jgi:MoaA/NifB/PqqE/SkfB family radical SAM enzyme
VNFSNFKTCNILFIYLIYLNDIIKEGGSRSRVLKRNISDLNSVNDFLKYRGVFELNVYQVNK